MNLRHQRFDRHRPPFAAHRQDVRLRRFRSQRVAEVIFIQKTSLAPGGAIRVDQVNGHLPRLPKSSGLAEFVAHLCLGLAALGSIINCALYTARFATRSKEIARSFVPSKATLEASFSNSVPRVTIPQSLEPLPERNRERI